ncbi:MAG: hypothetical protein RLZZ176_244 [Cyanobacteriota bacterium]
MLKDISYGYPLMILIIVSANYWGLFGVNRKLLIPCSTNSIVPPRHPTILFLLPPERLYNYARCMKIIFSNSARVKGLVK